MDRHSLALLHAVKLLNLQVQEVLERLAAVQHVLDNTPVVQVEVHDSESSSDEGEEEDDGSVPDGP